MTHHGVESCGLNRGNVARNGSFCAPCGRTTATANCRSGVGLTHSACPSAMAAICAYRPFIGPGRKVAFGREARVQGSRREGPESPPKPPFHSEHEIALTAQKRSLPGDEAVYIYSHAASIREDID